MGDSVNVSRRYPATAEESPPKAASLNDLDKDNIKKSQPVNYVLQNPVGEAGDVKCRLHEVPRSDKDITQAEPTEPLLPEPEAVPFPYLGTKLRPDAPPFTPENIASVVNSVQEEPGELNNDESCFVTVDFDNTKDLENIPDPVFLKEAKELKEVALTPFSLTSATRSKKTAPQPEISMEETEDIVVSVPGDADRVTEDGIQTTPSVESGGCLRYFTAHFFLNNRTQIAVLIASSIVSLILMIYVLL